MQSHCKWLLSKHQPQGPGKRKGLCAVPDPSTWHLVTAANTSPLTPPHSAGRGWTCWNRDEKLSGQEAEKKSEGGIMKLRPRKPTPALGSVREAGVGCGEAAGVTAGGCLPGERPGLCTPSSTRR